MRPRYTARSFALLFQSSGLLAMAAFLAAGCNRPASTQAAAPGLAGSDEMPTLRNVADPNAPYTLRSPASPPQAIAATEVNAGRLPVCDAAQLSLFESRSRMRGNQHSLQLTLENQGAGCRVHGYPSVTLLDPEGAVVSGVTFEQVSAGAVSATLGGTAASASEPTPEVLLSAHSDAVFEIAWTSGPGCRTVSRIAVAAPGSTAQAYVPRQMQLCGDRVLITAVAPGGVE